MLRSGSSGCGRSMRRGSASTPASSRSMAWSSTSSAPPAGGETLQAVISGSADLTVGIGTAAVLRAYSKGAPIRVIGVNFTGAGDLYWYVRAVSQSVRVDMVNADVFKRRKDAVLRFVQAYRETLDWMFSSPEAIQIYADETNVPVELAAMTRDKFQTKEAMRNDRLSDLDAVMAQAVRLKFLDKPLSKEQLAELIQIPPP